MAQGLLPFKYEEVKKEKSFTGLGGLLLYVEFFKALGLEEMISRNVQVRKDSQGYSDAQHILSLILLHLAGGDCVDDIEKLERDEGFCRILEKFELRGKSRKEREKIRRRWRKQRERCVGSPSSIFRYLANFHNTSEELKRKKGKAFVPAKNEDLRRLCDVNYELVEYCQKKNPVDTATLNIDATLLPTSKRTSLYAYKEGRCYQPMNVWWQEQDLVLHTEFRDGNVSSEFDMLRIFKESLLVLPEGVERVYLRVDAAGYQHELMRYCARGDNERFGKIGYAVSSDVNTAFKNAILKDKELEWNRITRQIGDNTSIETNYEWAEVCFVPTEISRSKKDVDYTFLAIRERLEKQESFPGMEDQKELPFHTIELDQVHYKLTAIATNLDWDREKIILWHRKRCGKSEEAHSVMKSDLGGGKLPSWDFGSNAAWWWIMILALNINNMMKRLVLGKGWGQKRMKAVRYHIINLPARVVDKGSEFIVRLCRNHPSLPLLLNARKRIMELACLPSG